jgi:hypothetical protein
MSWGVMAVRCHSERVLKSFRITLPGRPAAEPARVEHADVEALRGAADLARVGLWPPPRS